jgi:hypothetical protein
VLDPVSAFGDQILVRGWAVDEDAMTTPLAVHVYVDGRGARAARADRTDARVTQTYPLAGTTHGYSEMLTLPPGPHTVCIYAINVGPSVGNPRLGCATVTTGPAASNPQGGITASAVAGRTATLTGWAVDPQAPTSATSIHLRVDGVLRQAVPADRPTSSVSPYVPFGVSTAHGFQASLTLAAGTHRVCAYAINSGAGTSNPELGCVSVTVAASAWNPVGNLDSATVDGRNVDLSGWALDHDTANALRVDLYVDGRGTRSVTANAARPDIDALYPGTGSNHGFSTRLALTAGTHSVCAYAINVGSGSSSPQIGCRTVTMPAAAYNPVGALDPVVVTPGALTIRGWAYDPDVATTPIRVHVYVDGRGFNLAAGLPRPDIAVAHPEAGTLHGYSTTVPVTSGSHSVCAYGINVGAGTGHTTLGCVTVPS